MSYKIKFNDSARFIATSFSNLADNLTEGVKCKDCKKIDEDLKKRFKNTYKFSSNDIEKFIFLLRKNVYPVECMDDQERFNETSLLEKKFYSC